MILKLIKVLVAYLRMLSAKILYRVKPFTITGDLTMWKVQWRANRWFSKWYDVPRSAHDSRRKAEAFRELLKLGIKPRDICIKNESEQFPTVDTSESKEMQEIYNKRNGL